MESKHTHPIREFGDFELDANRRVLVSRLDGAPVEITGRVLDALIFLVERPGQLVDKKTLIEALWPNVVVEDGNLTQTIHTLRRVLGEKAGEHRYIATVPGRGYQFVAGVTTRGTPSAPSPPAAETQPARQANWVLPAVAASLLLLAALAAFFWNGRNPPVAIAAVNTHPSIAVLPFVDMSDTQDQVHFAEGLSEEVLNVLAHADNLRVIARTSSFSFRGENVDIRTIAQRLEVSHVLEGSVRKSGDRLRITAQLIDASNSAHVWSDTYDRDMHDILGVQQEIAAAVAGALRVKLAHEGPRRAETSSTEAYEHYLQGRHLFNRRSAGDLLQAKTHFDAALRIDPGYARAWSALAGVYFVTRYENIELPDALENWGHAAERATTLDPQLAEGHVRAAQYYSHVHEIEKAHAELARAAALDPQEPMVLSIAMTDAIDDGRMEDAVALQRRIVAIDPLSASQRGNLGCLLIMIDQFTEAQAELERALELSPAAVPTEIAISDALILQGRIDEALRVIDHMPEGFRRDERRAMALFKQGNDSQGKQILERLIAETQAPDFDPNLPLAIAELNAARNAPDLAFQWLDRALPRTDLQRKLKPYWVVLEDLQTSPYLRPLHTDPRWAELLTTVKARLWE
jgi:adenylate cyclase